jgi:cytochrome c oxidase assembly protein subunit 15
MPFDERNLPGSQDTWRRHRRQVAAWLFVVAGMILVMVVLGGATRLTGSGLSIMEWAPLSGALPPLSGTEWHRLFALYRQIPQYRLLNPGMDLAGFQQIFWLEWAHRLWGRLLGVVFLLPLVFFWATGRLERPLLWRLAGLFLLGGLQGAVGWFMVASGFLPDSTAVAPARLVVHLAMALLLYSAVVWTGLSVLRPQLPALLRSYPGARRLRPMIALCALLAGLTILAGGFTAGTHAGLIYNSFPLMDGRLVPADYLALAPWPRNLFENVAAVQFDHRLLASLTAMAILASLLMALRTRLPRAARRAMLLLAAAVAAQYALGVATLLSVVAVPIAVAHQAGAVLLLTAVLLALHALRDSGAVARLPSPAAEPEILS